MEKRCITAGWTVKEKAKASPNDLFSCFYKLCPCVATEDLVHQLEYIQLEVLPSRMSLHCWVAFGMFLLNFLVLATHKEEVKVTILISTLWVSYTLKKWLFGAGRGQDIYVGEGPKHTSK
jgi:hypothetical protein